MWPADLSKKGVAFTNKTKAWSHKTSKEFLNTITRIYGYFSEVDYSSTSIDEDEKFKNIASLSQQIKFQGRDLLTGKPKEILISYREIHKALSR